MQNINDLIEKLTKFNLTQEEASLFIYLLKVKSATVHDIHLSDEFRTKKRPNLYKLLSSLVEKKAVITEVKNRKTMYFAVKPEVLLDFILEKKENELNELRKMKSELIGKLVTEYKIPTKIHSKELLEIPENIREIKSEIISQAWILREKPQFNDLKALGKQYSFELETENRFGGNSAGIIITEFRYPEHRNNAFKDMNELHKNELKKALETRIGQGPIYLKKTWLTPSKIKYNLQGSEITIHFTEINGKLNIPLLNAKGAFCTLLLKDLPNNIITIWTSNMKDFQDLILKCNNFIIKNSI